MQGHTIDGLQAVILASLVGNTITGTHLTVTLNQAEDDIDPAIGAYHAADGGVVVLPAGGASTGNAAPSSTGGRVQRMTEHTFQVRVTYDAAGVTGQKLATDASKIIRSLVNLIEAGLEPQSGANYNVTGIRYSAPRRHAEQKGFYLQELTVTLREFWARS